MGFLKKFKSGINYQWFLSYWWIIVILLDIIIVTIFSCFNRKDWLYNWADLLTKTLTPISIILTIILGYPILKRKLTDSYITKQFNIIDDSNRIVRKECIELLDKYVINGNNNSLNINYLDNVVKDIQKLKYLSIDAATNVYLYTNLIYQSLINLQRIYRSFNNNQKEPHYNYKEELDRWINLQLQEVFSYSRTIGSIPSGNSKSRKRLNRKLSKFVSDNTYIEISDIAHSLDYKADSAMLVLFFERCKEAFSYKNIEFYLACYKSAPTPCPFARLLYNSEIYFPPVLCGKELIFGKATLLLIGYNKRKSLSQKGEENFYICTYANISNISFVYGTLNNLDDLREFKDDYLNSEFIISNYSNFSKRGECIQLYISLEKAEQQYKEVRNKLINQLELEMY